MEPVDILNRNKVHIALIQETKLQANSKTPTFSGYSTNRLDRLVMTVVGACWRLSASRSSTPTPLGGPPVFSSCRCWQGVQTVPIKAGNTEYHLSNVYIPPSSSLSPSLCPWGHRPCGLPPDPHGGDFSAHDPSCLSTQGGDKNNLLNQLEEMTVLNENSPTRFSFNPDTHPTPPGISFASPDLSLKADWRCRVNFHLIISQSWFCWNFPPLSHLPKLQERWLCLLHLMLRGWMSTWLQLHASLVHVSACSFAVSQASDLALLVGYVA